MLWKYSSNSCCCFTAWYGKQHWFIEFEADSFGRSHFITRDSAQAKAIEGSEPFRNGRITLDDCIDEEAEAAKQAEAATAIEKEEQQPPVATSLEEVKGITTFLSGLQFLKDKGYVGGQIKTKAALKAKANEMGYDFVDLIG